jgi:hypothetical protein
MTAIDFNALENDPNHPGWRVVISKFRQMQAEERQRQTLATPIAIGEMLAAYANDPSYQLTCRQCLQLPDRYGSARVVDGRVRLTCGYCGADAITFEAITALD